MGGFLNTETVLCLTKTWCFDFITKISTHHSLSLLLQLGAVQFDGNIGIWEGWGLCFAPRVLCCGTGLTPLHVPSASAPPPLKLWNYVKEHSLLTRGVVMTEHLDTAFCLQGEDKATPSSVLSPRNEGLQEAMGLLLTHFAVTFLESPGIPCVAALKPVSLIGCVVKTRPRPSKKQLCFPYSHTLKKPL